MDKKHVTQKLREHLARRLSQTLGCETEDFATLKLGTLIHTIFLIDGRGEELGGFNTTIHGILQLLGREVVWADPELEERSEEKAVVN